MPPVERGAPLRGIVCGDVKLRMDSHDGLKNALDTLKNFTLAATPASAGGRSPRPPRRVA